VRDLEGRAKRREERQRDRFERLEGIVYAQHEKLDRLENLVFRIMHRDRITENTSTREGVTENGELTLGPTRSSTEATQVAQDSDNSDDGEPMPYGSNRRRKASRGLFRVPNT
jgi:hypothetical protein